MTLTRAKLNSAIAGAVTAGAGTNTPTGDQPCANAAVDAINVTRGGRPAAVLPPMITDASAAAIGGTAAEKSAEAKKAKYLADPLNIVVVKPDYNDSYWGAHTVKYIPMRKLVEN